MRIVRAAGLAFAAALFVCPSFGQLPSLFPEDEERSAKVMQLTGQVSILKGTEPWVLNIGDWIHSRQTIVTGHDGFALFQVNDGSTFEVFPDSRVIFRNNSGNLKDILDLFLGRVRVHIQKFGGQPNRNNVRTPTAVISVRGTIFDVSIEDEDSTTLVLVEEGQVTVRHALIPYSEQKVLNEGDFLRVYKNQPLAQKTFDKGSAIKRALNAATEAAVIIMRRTPGTGSGGGSTVPGGGGTPGDTGKTDPPPPPPAPAPPPPPPPQ